MRLIKPVLILTFIASAVILTLQGYPAGDVTNHPSPQLSIDNLYAQEIPKQDDAAVPEREKEPSKSSILYQVMGVVLFIWIGLAVFLFRLDRNVARLEARLKDLK